MPPPPQPPPPTGEAYTGNVSKVKTREPMGLAIVSLVLALIGCCAGIVPIITSLMALSRVGRGVAGGKLVAQIALVISTFWLITSLAAGVLAVKLLTFRDGTGHFTKEGYTAAADLRIGDCLKKPDTSPIFVRVGPCSLPHETEIFAMYPRTPSTTDESAAAQCAPAFKEYVGKKLENSELELTAVNLAASRFTTTGLTACLVGMKDGADTAGTLRGANR